MFPFVSFNPSVSRIPAALLTLTLTGAAAAAPFQLELKGRFGEFDRFDPLSIKSFVATLNYDDRAFDPDLSTFSGNTFGYLADGWDVQLAEVNGKSIPGPSSASYPDSAGFITLRSEGGDPDGSTDESELTVGVYNNRPQNIEDAFLSPSYLFATFRNDNVTDGADLPDLPGDFRFTSGTIVYEAQVFALSDVAVRTRELRDEPARPEAVPTPAALAGGLMLLAGLLTRRRRD